MDLCYAIRCTVCLATYPIGFQRQLYKECFVFQIPLSSFFLRSSSSCWRLFPPILIPYILPPIFPSTTRLRIQLLHKMWPIELAVLCFIAFWILTSLDCAVLFRYVWNKKKSCRHGLILVSAEMCIMMLTRLKFMRKMFISGAYVGKCIRR